MLLLRSDLQLHGNASLPLEKSQTLRSLLQKLRLRSQPIHNRQIAPHGHLKKIDAGLLCHTDQRRNPINGLRQSHLACRIRRRACQEIGAPSTGTTRQGSNETTESIIPEDMSSPYWEDVRSKSEDPCYDAGYLERCLVQQSPTLSNRGAADRGRD